MFYDDVHVLRGAPVNLHDHVVAFPDTTFQAGFQGTAAGDVYSGHGVHLNMTTGVLWADTPAPAGPGLRNFLVTCTDPGSTRPDHIRVHVHDSVTGIWLTPADLTLRIGAEKQRLTVLAEFDDHVVGEVQVEDRDLSWDINVGDDQITLDSTTGELTAVSDSAVAEVRVSYGPLPSPALRSTAVVRTAVAWDQLTPRPQLKWIAGAGDDARDDVFNILFVSEGFQESEEFEFESLVRSIVEKLRTEEYWRPYKDLAGSLNYWLVFVPAPEPGPTILTESYRSNDLYTAVPAPKQPPAAPAKWGLEHLVFRVGLPVQDDANLSLAQKLADWQQLYDPTLTQAQVEGVFPEWKELATRTLLNEHDTGFGFAYGERPRADESTVAREIRFNPKRTQTNQFFAFLRSLEYAGASFGATWAPDVNDPWNAPGGKDRGLVSVLVRSDCWGGVNFGDFYTCAAGNRSEWYAVRAAPAPLLGNEPVPWQIKTDASPDVVHVVAHETAHGRPFGLGDEYGERLQQLTPGASKHFDSQNLETWDDLTGNNTKALDGDRIRWQWPRIVKAATLQAQPAPGQQANTFRLTFRDRQADVFRVGDVGRLRKRPLPDFDPDPATPEPEMRVTAVVGTPPTGIDVELVSGTLPPARFPAGTVFYVPRLGATGGGDEELPLVHPDILIHISMTEGPLNAPKDNPTRACVTDAEGGSIMHPQNLPDSLNGGGFCPRRWSPKIVGLYEGGAQYNCGVYHPAGTCMMRNATNPKEGTGELCQVCRYILVDRVDPSKHGPIDEAYDRYYPRTATH